MADNGAAGGITFFHYRDDAGRDVIVSDIKDVPARYREHMEIIDERALKAPAAATTATTPPPRVFLGVDGPSFALGFVIAFCLGAFVWGRARGGPRMLVKLAVVVAGVVVAGALYLGFALKTAGVGSGGAFATPADAVNEARAAVDKANATTHAQERALEKIDH